MINNRMVMVVLSAHSIPSSHHYFNPNIAVCCECKKNKNSLSFLFPSFLIYAGEAWVSQYTISFFISFQLVHNGSLIQQDIKRISGGVKGEGDGVDSNDKNQSRVVSH